MNVYNVVDRITNMNYEREKVLVYFTIDDTERMRRTTAKKKKKMNTISTSKQDLIFFLFLNFSLYFTLDSHLQNKNNSDKLDHPCQLIFLGLILTAYSGCLWFFL